MHPYPKSLLNKPVSLFWKHYLCSITSGVLFIRHFDAILKKKHQRHYQYWTVWNPTESCLHPHWLYTVPTKTTLILLTLLTESRCACNFRPNSGSACPKFFTARSRINFWALTRWFPMFSTNRSLSSGFNTFKDSVVHENQIYQVHKFLLSQHLFF